MKIDGGARAIAPHSASSSLLSGPIGRRGGAWRQPMTLVICWRQILAGMRYMNAGDFATPASSLGRLLMEH